MFRDISPWHLALILLAFVVLFGYKKLPDATRSLGRSMRIFKSEVKGLHDDEPRSVESNASTTAPATAPQTQAHVAPPAQPAAPASPASSETRADAERR